MRATLGVWGVSTTLCLAAVRPRLEYRVRFRTSQFRGDAWKLTKVPVNCYQDGSVSYKTFIMESPRKLKLFVWKLRVDLVAATTIVKSNTKIIAKFSLVLADNTTQGQQPQTQAGRFRLRKQHGQTLQERLSNLCSQRISRLGLTKSWLTHFKQEVRLETSRLPSQPALQ